MEGEERVPAAKVHVSWKSSLDDSFDVSGFLKENYLAIPMLQEKTTGVAAVAMLGTITKGHPKN
ncbi:hypothetical protein ACHAW6_012384 [Cyclotella cf. meneghiniana]